MLCIFYDNKNKEIPEKWNVIISVETRSFSGSFCMFNLWIKAIVWAIITGWRIMLKEGKPKLLRLQKEENLTSNWISLFQPEGPTNRLYPSRFWSTTENSCSKDHLHPSFSKILLKESTYSFFSEILWQHFLPSSLWPKDFKQKICFQGI